ncbi:hypothetical protein BDZ91DRAFT_786567 [Kalaharituber pfeilii]|nr:hypothetical protein BDZ91DRAFT_786567 [Kalaharituber pfeilii]
MASSLRTSIGLRYRLPEAAALLVDLSMGSMPNLASDGDSTKLASLELRRFAVQVSSLYLEVSQEEAPECKYERWRISMKQIVLEGKQWYQDPWTYLLLILPNRYKMMRLQQHQHLLPPQPKALVQGGVAGIHGKLPLIGNPSQLLEWANLALVQWLLQHIGSIEKVSVESVSEKEVEEKIEDVEAAKVGENPSFQGNDQETQVEQWDKLEKDLPQGRGRSSTTDVTGPGEAILPKRSNRFFDPRQEFPSGAEASLPSENKSAQTQPAPSSAVAEISLPQVEAAPELSPLLPPPPRRDSRSRLFSITPSLAAELELDEEYTYTRTSSNDPETEKSTDSRNGGGKRHKDIPILSSFSTDTSTDVEDNAEETEKMTRQANPLLVRSVPGEYISLVEITTSDPAMGRKRSVKRKLLGEVGLGKSKLAEECESNSKRTEEAQKGTGAVRLESSLSQFQCQLPRLTRQAHPTLYESTVLEGPQLRPIATATTYFEGLALKLSTGVYVPLSQKKVPHGVESSLIYQVTPRKDVTDGSKKTYHAIHRYLENSNQLSPGEGLYTFDELKHGFVLTQGVAERDREPKSFTDGRSRDVEIEVKQQQQQAALASNRQGIATLQPSYRSHGLLLRNLLDDTSPQVAPIIRRKEARLLGLGGGTRGVGNIDVLKGEVSAGDGTNKHYDEKAWEDAAAGSWEFNALEEGANEGLEDEQHGGAAIGEGDNLVTRDIAVRVGGGKEDIFDGAVVSDMNEEACSKLQKSNNKMGESWLHVGSSTELKASSEVEAQNINGNVVPPDEVYIHPLKRSSGWNKERLNVHLSSPNSSSPPQEITIHEDLASTNPFTKTPLPAHQNQDSSDNKTAHFQARGLPPLSLTSSLPQNSHHRSHKPRKKYVTVTLNLHTRANEYPRTSRILIPILSPTTDAGKAFDDAKLFGRIKREYAVLRGGEWRAWWGLRGVKWARIVESPRVIGQGVTLRTRMGRRAGGASRGATGGAAVALGTPIDPALTRAMKIVGYINHPRRARGHRGYVDLVCRGAMPGTARPTSYSVEMVEDWVIWRVVVAALVPVLGSVVGTVIAWFLWGWGGNGYGVSGDAFLLVGILVAVVGWGGVWVLAIVS